MTSPGLGEKMHFAEKARLVFTKGLPHTDPIALVESGQRSLNDWLRVLAAHRDLEEQTMRNQARERCQFGDDQALRYAVFALLQATPGLTTNALHRALPAGTRLASLRKVLMRLCASGQIMDGGLDARESTTGTWFMTLRGTREHNAHLARTEVNPLSSARKSTEQTPLTGARKCQTWTQP